MSDEITFRYLNPEQQERFTFTMYQVLTSCGFTVTETTQIERDLCQQFSLAEIGHIRPEQVTEAQQWMVAAWMTDQLDRHLRKVSVLQDEIEKEVQTSYLMVNRQKTLLVTAFRRGMAAILLLALILQPVLAWRTVPIIQQAPSVATSRPIDLTDLPANARPISFDNLAALEWELATRKIPTFYSAEATRADLPLVPFNRINTDCQNGRTPSEEGKTLLAKTLARIAPCIYSLGGTLYPDVSAYFGQQFTSDCIMKFDSYTQSLLASYGSPAMLVQIDPTLGGGVATMIFYKATGEAQFLFYSLEQQYIANNVMRLDHPAVDRQSVINDELHLAFACYDYKPEGSNRSDTGRCPFCDLCRVCLNPIVRDANAKYNLLKAGIESSASAAAITQCRSVPTFLYRAACLVSILLARKIALNAAAEDYNKSVRDALEQCKKDIAEKTKDLPGGVVRCEYRETPQ